MELRRLLEKKKSLVLREWIAAIFDTYPDDTGKFFQDEQDMFANPIGHTTRANAQNILEGLIEGVNIDALSAYVEAIIQIRAVQHFTPVQAVSFINSLKTVMVTHLKPEINKYKLWDEWDELEAIIEDLTLQTVKAHRMMIERIQHIREREIENQERFLIKLMGSRTR